MSGRPGTRRFWPAFALAAILSARLFTLLPAVIDDDEGWFAASANALTGPGSFFRRAVDDKPPGAVWFDAAVRWGMGPLHLAQWSRLWGLLALGISAALLARIARTQDGGTTRAAAWTAVVFLLACGAFSPKLFALTNEQLLLAPLCLALLAVLDTTLAPRPVRWVIAGAAVGLATWIKQTAVVFLLPLLLAWEGAGAAGWALAAFAATAFAGAWMVGLADYWRWTWVYPREVLLPARRRLFSSGSAAAWNLGLFALALAPVLFKAREGVARWGASRDRRALGGWLAAATLAVVAGKALFPHYLLLLLPPLALFAGRALAEVPFKKWQVGWLAVAYLGCAVAAAWPTANLFWGNDLPFFTRAAGRIAQLARPDERVFLWGGSPVPLAISGRPNATRFLTSRFLVPPYATPTTARLFHDDFLSDPPALVVDLHARGDNLQNLPPESIPWLGGLLAAQYEVWADPALPWARFYLRVDRLAGRSLAGLCRSTPLRDARDGYPRSLTALSRELEAARERPWPSLSHLRRQEARLRGAFSRELFSTSCPGAPPLPPTALAPDAIARVFAERGFASPLPADGLRFWVELATVELQPVLRPRPPLSRASGPPR